VTAATAASIASPPPARTAWPARSACSSTRRYRARCSGVERARSIVPAPPWMTSVNLSLPVLLGVRSSGDFSSDMVVE
jgi:hypothetical protein